MEYYSAEDIEEMKQNGYEEETITKARAIQERANELIAIITDAFDGVVLEDGIGLDEAQAIDDYKTLEQRQFQRLSDEKERWRDIPVAQLNRCNSSLSFFDAKGMRFHLPAFMIADVKNQYNFGMSFCLTYLNDYSKAMFSLFNQKQREAVRCFLNYAYSRAEYEYDSRDIADALLGFWCEGHD
ncbi:MAG TPA: DUF6714 family protein [Cellvibrionaceae bacterium]